MSLQLVKMVRLPLIFKEDKLFTVGLCFQSYSCSNIIRENYELQQKLPVCHWLKFAVWLKAKNLNIF